MPVSDILCFIPLKTDLQVSNALPHSNVTSSNKTEIAHLPFEDKSSLNHYTNLLPHLSGLFNLQILDNSILLSIFKIIPPALFVKDFISIELFPLLSPKRITIFILCFFY